MTALPPLLQLAASRKGRPRRAPTIDDALAALATEPGLNPWSRSFVNSIAAAQIRLGCRLSPKQLGCIDKILAAAWRGGVRPNARQRA